MVFCQNKAFVTKIMCFDELNMNKQSTMVLKEQFSFYLQIKESPTREDAVRDVNRCAMLENV